MKEFKKAGDKVTIEDVYESCRRYITNEDDMKLIKKAYDYIMVKHEGQKRKSGEPYTIHLIWVAYILSTLQTGPLTITAGLLHDVMEDCDVSREEMMKEFGEEVTTLVEGVTKISKMPLKMKQTYMLKIIVKSILRWLRYTCYLDQICRSFTQYAYITIHAPRKTKTYFSRNFRSLYTDCSSFRVERY